MASRDDRSSYGPWRDLVADIRALRLTVYDIADRLRSLSPLPDAVAKRLW